ncbi:MAG: DUF3429 domain-containing protein [Pseudomonadota bacterium]
MNSEPSALAAVSAPRSALLLGFAGVVPFIGLTVAITMRGDWLLAERAFAYYSALILSFLGGIRWGVVGTQLERRGRDLLLSVLPSLVAWIALLGGDFYTRLAVLMLGHLLTAVTDGLIPPRGQFLWLRTLRLQLSGLVLVTHAILLTVLL